MGEYFNHFFINFANNGENMNKKQKVWTFLMGKTYNPSDFPLRSGKFFGKSRRKWKKSK